MMLEPEQRKIKNYWKLYQEYSGIQLADKPMPEAWGFGDSPEMADELGRLVISGDKRATCSLFIEYEMGGEELPEPGQFSIILDGRDAPICIIETTGVEIKQFDQVDANFAFEEGEGDRSLEFWREAHQRFFRRQCEQMDLAFHEKMTVVCERFRVIFPPDVIAGDRG